MKDEDLTIKLGQPSAIDKATKAVMSRQLNQEELDGFGKIKKKPPDIEPHIGVILPSKATGHEGITVEVGVKGKF